MKREKIEGYLSRDFAVIAERLIEEALSRADLLAGLERRIDCAER